MHIQSLVDPLVTSIELAESLAKCSITYVMCLPALVDKGDIAWPYFYDYLYLQLANWNEYPVYLLQLALDNWHTLVPIGLLIVAYPFSQK